MRALAANQLGFEYLDRGKLECAERAMLEAFRLRVLYRKRELSQSYRALGLLRMAQGDLAAAGVLLDRAVEAAGRDAGRVPNWAVYYSRGELRSAEHKLPEAVKDFRTALELARAWRLEILPADSLRASAEVELDQIYSSFIRAAGALYFESGATELAQEAFSAAEEMRSVSLRAALLRGSNWRDRLPAGYGAALSELRAARAVLLRGESREARERIARLRNQLAEMEMRAGLETSSSRPLEEAPQRLSEIARSLDPSEALFSFHLDEPHSYAWVVTQDRFRTFRLAGAGEIRAAALDFSDSVRDGAKDPAAGSRLYAMLFGEAGPAAESRRHWLLAVEDVLYGAPLSALAAARTGAGAPVYLVERHAVTMVPGALVLRRAAEAGPRGRFVGIGDPIYNVADERWGRGPARDAALQLPRLPGSAREIRDCAQAWPASSAPVLLQGGSATRRTLAAALADAPGAIHFATHVIRSAENPARRLIPLSLLPGGEPEYIGPEDIAAWRLPRPALVVISGCASGAPERRVPEFAQAASGRARNPASAVGLVGLARAWLRRWSERRRRDLVAHAGRRRRVLSIVLPAFERRRRRLRRSRAGARTDRHAPLRHLAQPA